jgi:hypothetical protein
MTARLPRIVLLACLSGLLVALAGCRNPDAPVAETSTLASPQNAGEPRAEPPPAPAAQAPFGVQPTPQRALAQYAVRYVNWSYGTLTSDQRALAGMSVGAARLSEQQAAARTQADRTISRGRIWNHGTVIAASEDQAAPGMWLVVTLERTGGNSEYQGLPASYHVTLARLARMPGGWAVSEWLPRD